MLEDLVFDVISVTQDEVQMTLVMELHVTPVILPGFSFPMTIRIFITTKRLMEARKYSSN